MWVHPLHLGSVIIVNVTGAYLDHAATTPLRDAAREAMLSWLGPRFGNPSGSHGPARAAREAIEVARDIVAAALGARSREIVFTGGGTEALNLALTGSLPGATDAPAIVGSVSPRPTILTSAIEHDAVTNAADALARHGRADHVRIPVLPNGVLDLDALEALLRRGPVATVAVMAVNNEVGTVQPVPEVVDLVRRTAPGALVLVDAVQGAAWLDMAVHGAGADLMAISAHKFGGPQGVGALVVREGTVLEAMLFGGGQERQRRSGTQNVAGIVAMAEALRVTIDQRADDRSRVEALRDRLVDALVAAVPGCHETVPRRYKVAGNAHVCVEGVESESLLVLLDDGGVYASAGSACASGAIHTSPVLQAMGVDPGRAAGSLRLTLGPSTTDDDVDLVLKVVPVAVAQLRS